MPGRVPRFAQLTSRPRPLDTIDAAQAGWGAVALSTLCVVLLLMGLGLRLGLLDAAPPPARLLVAWGWLVLAPGFFVLRLARLGPGLLSAELIGVSTALGLVLTAALAWITALLGLPLSWAAAGSVAVSVAAASAGLLRRGRGASEREPRRESALSAGLVILAASVGLLLLTLGGTLEYPEDALAHVAAVRAAASSDAAMPAALWYRDGEVPGPDPRFGLWHAVAALLVRSAGLSAHEGWLLLPGILAPFAVLVASAFARALLPSSKAAALAVLLFVVGFGGWDERGMRTLADPTDVALLVHAAGMALFLLGLRGRRVRQQVAGAAICGGAVLAHVYGAIQGVAGFGALALACALTGRWRSWGLAAVRAAAVTAAVAAPYLAHWAIASFHPANPSNYVPQGVLWVSGRAFVWSPEDAIATLGFAGLAAFLTLPWLWREGQRDPGLLYAAACASVCLLVLANPLLLPLLYRVMSYLALRLKYLVPVYAILAWAGWELAARARGRTFRAPALAGLGALVLLQVPTLEVRAAYFVPSVWEERPGPLGMGAELAELDRGVALDWPAPVIASDAWTSYAVPAFSDCRVLAIPAEHASPNDPRPVARLRATADILSPSVGLAETLDLVRAWHVTHVLVNLRHDQHFEGFEYVIDPERANQVREKFENYPDIFLPAKAGKGMALYRVDRASAKAALARMPEEPAASASATDLLRTAAPLATPAPGFSLLAFAVEPATARPGETVRVECVWRRDAPPAPGGAEPSWWVYLRADREGGDAGSGDRPGSKIARFVRERREGKRHRFRVRHAPAAGECPSYRWKEGQVVRDAWPVTLPASLAPGEYRLELAMRPAQVVRAHSLDYFLRDRDAFSGQTVGRLRVEG